METIIKHYTKYICLIFFFSIGLTGFTLVPVVRSGVVFDGTLGHGGILPGPDYKIGHDLGLIKRNNIFHSFSEFNLLIGERAAFTGPDMIENIIARVTGGDLSFIDGLIACPIQDANFFLINPSGVIFGPNAALDIKGSFHVSTADFIRMSDGGFFYADPSRSSVLSVAPPEAFGFLGDNPAGIIIKNSLLEVNESKALSMTGGDISIAGSAFFAPGGTFNLVSVASAGEAVFNTSEPATDTEIYTFEQLGDIKIFQESIISVDGISGGAVVIRGGRLMIDRSYIFANTYGSIDGAEKGVDIRIAQDMIAANNSLIKSTTVGDGAAGDILLKADSLTLTNAAQINSSTYSSGHGGKISIRTTDSVNIIGQSRDGISSGIFSNTEGSGSGGVISINTPVLNIQSCASIGIATYDDGDAGSILLDVGKLAITELAQIDSSSYSSGMGGEISIIASDSINISGQNKDGISSGIFSNTEAGGNSGIILISTPVLNMNYGGLLQASSIGDGDAGNILLYVDNLLLDGAAQISSSSYSAGMGGEISIWATDSVNIAGQSRDGFSSGLLSNTYDGSNGGIISVFTPVLNMDDGSVIQAATTGCGNAGDILLQVGNLNLTKAAQINSSSYGFGLGGKISIAAAGSINISGQNKYGFSSGLFSIAESRGNGGIININSSILNLKDRGIISAGSNGSGEGGSILLETDNLLLSGAGLISSSSYRSGNAGNIIIDVSDTMQSNNSAISTESRLADGGDIELNADYMVHLMESEITASVNGGNETVGGNITIDPEYVILKNSRIVANAFEGRGGNVRITAGTFLYNPESIISASSAMGIDGSVDIQAPIMNVSGFLSPLPSGFLSETELLREPCEIKFKQGKSSSFVIYGCEGLPIQPGGLLPGPIY